MKRLFCVKNAFGTVVEKDNGELAYFDNKMESKQFRDAGNKVLGRGEFHVSCGPDHIGPHGHGKVPRMRRQPKRV